MIHIEYKIDKSRRHGVGLFTTENLKKEQLVYTASPLLDVDISQKEYDSLDEKEKREIRYWGFWIKEDKVWHVDFDVSRFINHSYEATLTQDPKHKDAYLVTTRNVKAGDELTQNYLEFESENDLRKRGIKIKNK